MKRKRGSKSKDREKSKIDETKSHKHSRRKRKSSDSESEGEPPEPSEVTPEQTEDSASRRASSRKPEDMENNASITRITRHSKRLAAISASSEELREEIPEVISSPVKTGKLSPFSSGSPGKEHKKKEGGTPEKHRLKEQDVWKVKSTNGAGSGELQKLKICRQRSPENIPLPGEPQPNNFGESINRDEEPREAQDVAVEQMEKPTNCVEECCTEPVSNEVNLADIELPATEFVVETKTVGETANEVEKPVEDVTAAAVVALVEVQPPLVSVGKISDSVNVEKTEEKPVIEKEEQPEQSALLNDVAAVENVAAVDEIQLPSDSASMENERGETNMAVEKSQSSVEISVKAPIAKRVEIPEQEDIIQAEIELTVDENAIEEPNTMAVAPESDGKVAEKKETELPAVVSEVIQPTIKSVDMEEVYDYENDDTKEEGELSANESMSPIHEIFKKYSPSLRKRSWGSCSISHFNRSNIFVDENTLKEYHIKKRTISKEEFDASDSEDLIFVKEIREENIVHEIESETNNISFYDKDDDDVVPSTPKRKSDSLEIKKLSLESDKIPDKSNKRIVKDKSLNHEGKSVLYITNLVRPFTVNQLRELLLRTGRIVEDGFWIDSIKSKCYVQFETEDEAFETRHALHGIRWPVNNPKVLHVQFATQDDLLSAQAQTHESEIPRKKEPLVVSNHTVDTGQKRIDWKKHFEQYDDRPKKIKDVREWDIGKPAHPDEMIFAEADDLKKREDQETLRRNRKDRRRRNEMSDEEIAVKKPRKKAADNPPATEAKLLDDLFRRTKAAPSIYWLPLSEEQIASKQETRRKHLEDIDRQMKKQNNDHQDPRRRDRDRERRRSRR